VHLVRKALLRGNRIEIDTFSARGDHVRGLLQAGTAFTPGADLFSTDDDSVSAGSHVTVLQNVR
jgi:hypothetical protein